MARALSIVCALGSLVVACSGTSNDPGKSNAVDVKACLDRPGELPRPPTGKLPCELVPPGLTLE